MIPGTITVLIIIAILPWYFFNICNDFFMFVIICSVGLKKVDEFVVF